MEISDGVRLTALTQMVNWLLMPMTLVFTRGLRQTGCQTQERWGVIFILPLSFRPKGGEVTGTCGARLPAQPTPSSARHTHRAADAGDVIVVKRRPAGVRVAVGGAPHVGVSGQNTPVHEAEREEAGYSPPVDDRASGSTDGCLGSVRGCGWRNVRTRGSTAIKADPHLQDGTSPVPGTAAQIGDEPARDLESGPAHAWCATNNPAFSSL